MTSGIVIPAAATVTASSALATAGFTWGIYRRVKRHERALYGAENINSWDGLVPKVNRHEEALEEEDLL
ncbi:hypothetical protein GJ633_04065 [Halorubrum sp. CBA1125]|uniref:hypothetical protein n=1 Tax=Halorubrum sp. CBA1125 TaxID=2668072 RepID=UPI0012E9270D|nr:hypothetical protein [Halorubrum sp. CBA1125]MUW13927.1 hypothetical protein [Halorubrum sp. CBA1125]